MRSILFAGSILLAVFSILPVPAAAGEYHVPSVATPTLQDAVDAAAAGVVDPQETIYIDGALDVWTTTVIGMGFNSGHTLLIRPGVTLLRQTIRMNAANLIVIQAVGASYVTIQDLDIFRHITNAQNIIYFDSCDHMILQRCRVGSDWTTPGSAGWAAIKWNYPFHCELRNCMTFATAPSTFQYGIQIMGHDDPGSILRVYNNSVQGFYGSGISVAGTAGKIIFRNNVVVTEQAIDPNPVGYNGNLGAVALVSSNNAVFCDPGDEWSGGDDIRGAGFTRFNFADIPACFLSWGWFFNNPNPAFLNLTGGGPIHTPATWGVTIGNHAPDPDDTQVVDDWERNVRPSGGPVHTDRGADQADLDGTVGVDETRPPSGLVLEAGPVPARGLFEFFVKSAGGRDISLRLFDSSGRLVREIWSGRADEGRTIRWDGSGLPSGVYFVSAADGSAHAVKKILRVR